MALRGIKVIELAGLAPAPFCGMILSDFGASVTRIDRPGAIYKADALARGKRSLILDLRNSSASEVLSKLCSKADVLIEPFRPGVMEKYNLGPKDLCEKNPRLIYARLTGFGQKGPYSKMAGHDINYIAIAGLLSALGPSEQKPYHPINILGDFAGGGLMCALGICMALFERHNSGKGQVIDSNMVEGSAYLSSWLWTTRDPEYQYPIWSNTRGNNLLDGGAPFYQTYKTKDGEYMAVGALEPQFYRALLKGLALDEDEYTQFSDWTEVQKKFAEVFASKTKDEWCKVFEYTDACVTPVVPLEQAHTHCHNSENKSFFKSGQQYFPSPAPTLSRTPGDASGKEPIPGQNTIEVLLESGYEQTEVDKFIREGSIFDINS